MKSFALLMVILWAGVAAATAPQATPGTKDLLIEFTNESAAKTFSLEARIGGAKIESLGVGNWVRVQFTREQFHSSIVRDLNANPNVRTVQPNYRVRLIEDYRVIDPALREKLARAIGRQKPLGPTFPYPDNPAFVAHGPTSAGPDPKFSNQWGMLDIGAAVGWKSGKGEGMVVAVIDTGVDYTHQDLIENLWKNQGETGLDSSGRDKASNGIDDDGNGFIDDVVGWDFVSNDNKPFDLMVSPWDLLMGGGNPGHGTHCAGNVAAVGQNGVGVAGVAPSAKIMAIRFLSEKGDGSTANAVKSINYAVKMGAKVLSNSWGAEGEDPNEAAENKALRDAIAQAQAQGVLFIAAAGNGHGGVGYDNDTDAKPAIPASLPMENIVSVAALDKTDKLGSFSNWGRTTVDIGAPGVAVYSTTVGSNYNDLVLDMPEYGIKVTWDGTSMATPHVAGAAALYWSMHPASNWMDVKNALIRSAAPISALSGKSVSGGKLNMERLVQQ